LLFLPLPQYLLPPLLPCPLHFTAGPRNREKLRRRRLPARRHNCPPTFCTIVHDAAARLHDIAEGFRSFFSMLVAAVPSPPLELR
jgi:hypothetical protein